MLLISTEKEFLRLCLPTTGRGSPSPETAPRSPGSFWLPRKPRDAGSSEKLTDVIYKFLMEEDTKELGHSVALTFLHPSSSSTHSKGAPDPVQQCPTQLSDLSPEKKSLPSGVALRKSPIKRE